jgi:L-aminopeptidase/D-esterase-like protein
MKGRTRKQNRDSRSEGTITDVAGIRVGHAHDKRARTGCTVILCEREGAVAGVDVRGAAPGTRETDLLEPGNLVERVHAVLLTGGSVFGLDAACGVVSYLEQLDIGFDAGVARVPIVPAAVIFDLAAGSSKVRPDSAMGYRACKLGSAGPVAEGQVGAGAGATVGKILGHSRASRGGIGTASMKLSSGVTVGVLVVVNAFGDIVDPESGRILAGARSPSGAGWLNTSLALKGAARGIPRTSPVENTTLAVVATDATLTKAQAKRVAVMSHDGMARAVRPVHTLYDGDTVFALSTGRVVADSMAIGTVAAELVARAIARVGHQSSAEFCVLSPES